MNILPIIILSFFLFPITLGAQITFNRADSLLFEASVATSIYDADSCYFISGVYADGNSDSLTIEGSYINKVDPLTGVSKDIILFVDSTGNKTFEHWRKNLQMTPDGNFIVSGYKREIGEILIPYILKFDLEGEIINQSFLEGYPGNEFDLDADYVILEDGSLIAATRCLREDQGENPVTEICLFKLGIEGEILWQKNIEDFTTRDYMGQMQFASSGNVILFGSKSLGHLDRHPLTWAQIIEIDQEGEVLRQWISETHDSLTFVNSGLVLEDGGFIITAAKAIEYFPNLQSIYDPVVIKLDSNFNEIWREYEVNRTDSLFSPSLVINKIIFDSDAENFIYVGDFHLIDRTIPPGQHRFDNVGYITKLSHDGKKDWQRYFQFFSEIENEDHGFNDIIQTNDNGFLICGVANHQGSLDDNKLQRSWLIKLDEYGCLVPGCHEPVSTSAPLQGKKQIKFKASPNPVATNLNVFVYPSPSFSEAELHLSNINGKLRSTYPVAIDNLTLSINVSNLAKGIYILSYIENGRLVQSEKFVKIE